MTRRKQPHISPRYAKSARAAANAAAAELKAAAKSAQKQSDEDTAKLARAYSEETAELNRQLVMAQRRFLAARGLVEAKAKTAIEAATQDRRAARGLRLEILDRFAANGDEAQAISELDALAG